jgi:polysaccharide export outer membrane protein
MSQSFSILPAKGLVMLLCATMLWGGGPASAQNAPTSEQLRLLQGLPPEQQQVLIDQLGVEGGQNAAGASESRPSSNTSARRGQASAPTEAADVLAPEDLVSVELALPGTMARGTSRDDPKRDANAETAPRRIRATPEQPLGDATLRRLRELIAKVQASNPYRLDRLGQLNLPGFPPIQLSGLNDIQAVQLLSGLPSLVQLDVSLLRLPVTRTGVDALKPFGYDMFDPAGWLFSGSGMIPVPADYVVGPGDEITVQLFGGQNRTHRLVVSRDGTISFPELGPIRIGGLRFTEARAAIQSRVSQQMIGVQANVIVGETRSISVLVLGEVRHRGTHTVDGMATMTTALFAAGGVTDIGSLRDVQLRRQNQIVRRLDLYDLLVKGDTADDAKLQPGDVVFVPPVGPTVSVEGEVRRPAIYELRGETSAAEVLTMAGGLTPQADPTRSSLMRIDTQYRRVVDDVDFRPGAGGATLVGNGDVIRVPRLRPQIDSGVTVEGFVHRPGVVSWRQGLRLTDVITSIDELKVGADARYVLIRRETGADRSVQVFSADLIAALAQRGGPADLALDSRDRITIFELAPGRGLIIKSLLDELRLQSGLARPTETVFVEGRIKVPGEYPLEPGMRVSDLLRAGGNLDVAAFGGQAELARYEVDATGTRQTALINVDLAAVVRGDPAANIPLRPFDYLRIKEVSEWSEQETVTLTGEVRIPGVYPIRRGETLHSLIQRAGGLSSQAFAKGSVFTRAYLRENEREQKERYATRLRSELAALSLQAAAANQVGAAQALAQSQSLLAELQAATPVGRMVIDMNGLLANGEGSAKDVTLRDGDLLYVPQNRQEVSVLGEVQNATSLRYDADLGRDDYIALSGGTTRKADKKRIHVVRADGSVEVARASVLRRAYSVAIQPGDTIVVPIDTERMPRLPFWQAVTQIIYNLAVSVAAINSF